MSETTEQLPTTIVIPPAEIRYRVASVAQSEEQYRQIGDWSAQEIIGALSALGHDITRFRRILDFGCGCSRILQYLHRAVPAAEFHGSDIDSVGVEWSRNSISYATFAVNGAMPPLSYEDRSFDFIYALSVFSHLNADMQAAWFVELARILAPGGLIYFTFSGPFVLRGIQNNVPSENIEGYDRDGFTFLQNITDKVLPDWYQTSLQNILYLKAHLPPSLNLVQHVPQGHLGWQDRAVAQKVA